MEPTVHVGHPQKPILLMRRPELVALLHEQYGLEKDALLGRTVQELRKTLDDLRAEGIQPGAPKKKLVVAAGGIGSRLQYAKRVLRRAGVRTLHLHVPPIFSASLTARGLPGDKAFPNDGDRNRTRSSPTRRPWLCRHVHKANPLLDLATRLGSLASHGPPPPRGRTTGLDAATNRQLARTRTRTRRARRTSSWLGPPSTSPA